MLCAVVVTALTGCLLTPDGCVITEGICRNIDGHHIGDYIIEPGKRTRNWTTGEVTGTKDKVHRIDCGLEKVKQARRRLCWSHSDDYGWSVVTPDTGEQKIRARPLQYEACSCIR